MVEILTNPIIVTVLLTIAGAGIVLELFSTKFGLDGLVGIVALVIFFYGHFQAGLAGYGTLILFVAGILLIFLEFFLPGAIAGTLGTAALILSLFLAGEDPLQTGVSILIAIIFSVFLFFLMIKVYGKKLVLLSKLVLSDSERTEDGYVSNVNRTDLLGVKGVTLTVLRPAGTGIFDKERVDVVSEGGFIDKNKAIKVIRVEGSRIVVREINK